MGDIKLLDQGELLQCNLFCDITSRMARLGTIEREISVVVTEYSPSWYILLEPVSSIATLGLIEDQTNELSPYLLEVPEFGTLATGWLVKVEDGNRLMLERLTHPGKGDPRLISAAQIGQKENGGKYIRARLTG